MWLAWGLASRGHRVTLFTLDCRPELWKGFQSANVRTHVLSTPPLARRIGSRMLNRSCYNAELGPALDGIDVVIAHNYPSYHWAVGARERRDRGLPVVWYCNEPIRRLYLTRTDAHFLAVADRSGSRPDLNRHLVDEARRVQARNARFFKRRRHERARRRDRQQVARLDRVLAISRFTRDNLAAIFGIAPRVCHPGVARQGAPETHGRAEPARGNGAGRSPVSFLVVGTAAPKKNLMNVLEAVRLLAGRGGAPRITLRIAGPPDAQEMARAHAEQHGLRDRVEPLGWPSDTALRRHYASCAATVYVPIDEPFGLVPVESMLEGTPPIVSHHGGPAEVVEHERTGLHVDPFDPEAIAAAMAALADDAPRRRALGEAGREAAHAHFTLDRFLDRFEAELAAVRKQEP